MSVIDDQGIFGNAERVSSDIFLEASPSTSIARTIAKRSTASAASTMCSNRIRSSACEDDLGVAHDVVTEVPAQIPRGTQVDPVTGCHGG